MHLGFAEDSFLEKPWVLISVTYVAKNNPWRRISIKSVCNKLKNRRKKQHGFEKKKKVLLVYYHLLVLVYLK